MIVLGWFTCLVSFYSKFLIMMRCSIYICISYRISTEVGRGDKARQRDFRQNSKSRFEMNKHGIVPNLFDHKAGGKVMYFRFSSFWNVSLVSDILMIFVLENYENIGFVPVTENLQLLRYLLILLCRFWICWYANYERSILAMQAVY